MIIERAAALGSTGPERSPPTALRSEAYRDHEELAHHPTSRQGHDGHSSNIDTQTGGFMSSLGSPPPRLRPGRPCVDCLYQETWNKVLIMENPSSSMGNVNIIINPELQRRCL